MKSLKKLLAVMLVACMLITTGISSVFAQAKTEEPMMAVFSIDAGRKYFSEEQLKGIIDKAYKNGYTDVQILLGNDALRFVLDDMTVEANGKTYPSDDVKKAVSKGNKSYYDDPNGDYLTEKQMDSIIEYAKARNIGIIPVINAPGHMDSILVTMETLGIENPAFNQSKRTVDIGNEEAVNFTKALITKYVNYFSKYSEIFNIGCDEYANDVDTGGWAKLQAAGLYPKFVEFVNDMSKIVKDANMRPMCFNDGIYYNQKDEFGTFDKDLIISYWTGGWWGYDVAAPKYFVEKGHDILNTNDGWYWVLGNIDDGGYRYGDALKNIENKQFNDVPKGGTSTPIIGSMQAVWCDFPEKEHDMDRVYNLMDAFSNKHSDILLRPANFEKVDQAIANIPQNLEIYTDESVKALNDAVAAVDRTLKEKDQAVVDGFAKAITDAINNLVLKTTALNNVPVINAEDVVLTVGDKFDVLDKVTANDKEDGDLTKSIEVVSNNVDTKKAGTYEVTYKVTDSQGASVVKTIKVTVKDKDTTTQNKPTQDKPSNNTTPVIPTTGDNASIFVVLGVVLVAGALIVVLSVKARKRR